MVHVAYVRCGNCLAHNRSERFKKRHSKETQLFKATNLEWAIPAESIEFIRLFALA